MSKGLIGEPESATDKFTKTVEKNVNDGKDVAAGYVEEAKNFAQKTAQVMVSERNNRGIEANYECPIGLSPRIREQGTYRRACEHYR